MKIIKFFSSFCSSEHCANTLFNEWQVYSDKEYGVSYKFTCDDDYTHVVILNTAMPNLKIPKENVIGLAYEPIQYLYLTQEFIDYAKKNIGRYFIGGKYNLPEPFIEHFSYMGHLIPPHIIPKKNKMMSIVFSEKYDAPGHKYRHQLVKKILETDMKIDIYGRGCSTLKKYDTRIKGSFFMYEPYLEYKYHIAIENYIHPSYVSEKFMNSIFCKTVPVYYGATRIEDYFPKSCFKLTGNIETDMKLIEAIYNGKMDIINKNLEYPDNMKFFNFIKNNL